MLNFNVKFEKLKNEKRKLFTVFFDNYQGLKGSGDQPGSMGTTVTCRRDEGERFIELYIFNINVCDCV